MPRIELVELYNEWDESADLVYLLALPCAIELEHTPERGLHDWRGSINGAHRFDGTAHSSRAAAERHMAWRIADFKFMDVTRVKHPRYSGMDARFFDKHGMNRAMVINGYYVEVGDKKWRRSLYVYGPHPEDGGAAARVEAWCAGHGWTYRALPPGVGKAGFLEIQTYLLAERGQADLDPIAAACIEHMSTHSELMSELQTIRPIVLSIEKLEKPYHKFNTEDWEEGREGLAEGWRQRKERKEPVPDCSELANFLQTVEPLALRRSNMRNAAGASSLSGV